jgi:hypothetical protein
LEYCLELSDTEKAIVDREDIWNRTLMYGQDMVDTVTVRSLLTGSSFESPDLTLVQCMEGFVRESVRRFRALLESFVKG